MREVIEQASSDLFTIAGWVMRKRDRALAGNLSLHSLRNETRYPNDYTITDHGWMQVFASILCYVAYSVLRTRQSSYWTNYAVPKDRITSMTFSGRTTNY